MVGGEIKGLRIFWELKGTEISDKFKDLYKPVPSGTHRRRGEKKVENSELSSYAADITKEFMTQVQIK